MSDKLSIPTDKEIIEAVEKHCEDTGVSITAFSEQATGNSKAVARLRNGKSSVRLCTARALVDAVNGKKEASQSVSASEHP